MIALIAQTEKKPSIDGCFTLENELRKAFNFDAMH